jgi:mannose-6-phosphate isomerase
MKAVGSHMPDIPLYPLRFEPIFKTAIWGGRRLAEMFPNAPDGPIGEAWVLSDQGDNVSVVADGPFKGTTLRELMRTRRGELLGPALTHHEAFPLLLKFIDACESLSVQVHPDDEWARTLTGVARGKTEAWIVMHAEPGSRIYAGLKAGVDGGALERAVANGTTVDVLHSFEPKPAGDCIFLPAGTVHALGGGITVFEVQQTSDVTYRLYDWDRVDSKTGRPRDLHIKQALACADFYRGPVVPVAPVSVDGPGVACRVVESDYFTVRHSTLKASGDLGREPDCRILIALRGAGVLRHRGGVTPMTLFRPALVPAGEPVSVEPDSQVSFVDIGPK